MSQVFDPGNKVKLLVGFAVALGLMGLAVVFALSSLQSASDRIDQLFQDDVESLALFGRSQQALLRGNASTMNAIHANDPGKRRESVADAKSAVAESEALLRQFGETSLGLANSEIVEDLQLDYSLLREAGTPLFEALLAGDVETAIILYMGDPGDVGGIELITWDIIDDHDVLAAAAVAEAKDVLDASHSSTSTSWIVGVGIWSASLAVGLAIGIYLAWSITAREQLIKRQRDELADAQSVAHLGSWSRDFRTGALTWSGEIYRIFGYEPNQVRATEEFRSDLVETDADRRRIQAAHQDVIENGGQFSLEYAIVRPDGVVRSVHSKGRAEVGGDGNPVRLFGTIQDITERKRAEEAMRENAARLQALFEGASDLIIVRDAAGAMIEANSAASRMLGYTREELLSLSVHDMVPPEYRDYSRSQLEASNTQELAVERILQRKDGSRILVDLRMAPLRDGRVIGIGRDITKRVRAEKAVAAAADELRKRLVAIEQTDDVIVLTDSEATITYVNPVFEKTTGYHWDEAIGQNPRMLKSGRQSIEAYEELWSTISGGQTWRGRLVNRCKDGALITEEVTISPVWSDSGKPLGYVKIAHDITKQLQLERGLADAQRMESIGTLAGGIAHDFNNLLAVVMGSAEMIKRETDDGHAAVELADEIIGASARGAALVRQLLAFSRRQMVPDGTFDVGTALTEAATLLNRIVGRSVTIVTEFKDDVPQIRMDRSQFEQVLTNLVVNARDAMPKGGEIAIELSGLNIDEESQCGTLPLAPGPYVRLRVMDNGGGMNAETASRIFEPFFTTKEVGKGTGLGLSTVYGIVAQAGGSIEVDSDLGVGTTVTVHLPAA